MAVTAPTDKRFRRAQVTPVAKRGRVRRWRRHVAYVLVLSAVVLSGAYFAARFLLTAEALTVRRITVSGNTRVPRGEVLSRLDGLSGRNMLLVNLEEWRQKILTSPWVEDAAIRRVLPDTVDVAIAERQPMGIGRVGDALYLLDQDGHVIDEFGPDHAEFDFPLIDGLVAAGRTGREALAVDEGRAALAMRLLASLQGRPRPRWTRLADRRHRRTRRGRHAQGRHGADSRRRRPVCRAPAVVPRSRAFAATESARDRLRRLTVRRTRIRKTPGATASGSTSSRRR